MQLDKKIRVFTLFGDIKEGETMQILFEEMQELLVGGDSERGRYHPILLINSRGGNTEDSFAIYSFLRGFHPNLTTIGFGRVESGAVYVFLAGQHRLCLPYTQFGVHEGAYSTKNTPISEFGHVAKSVEMKLGFARDILAKRSSTDMRAVRQWLHQGRSFSPEQALKCGLVHEIATREVLAGMHIQSI